MPPGRLRVQLVVPPPGGERGSSGWQGATSRWPAPRTPDVTGAPAWGESPREFLLGTQRRVGACLASSDVSGFGNSVTIGNSGPLRGCVAVGKVRTRAPALQGCCEAGGEERLPTPLCQPRLGSARSGGSVWAPGPGREWYILVSHNRCRYCGDGGGYTKIFDPPTPTTDICVSGLLSGRS